MREVASFEDERTARLFADVLCTREIESEISKGKSGAFSVWVLEERQVEPARAAFAHFDSNPEAPEHKAAAGALERKHRDEEARARVSRHEIIDVRRYREGSLPVRVTFGLVAACVVTALATRLGDRGDVVQWFFIGLGGEPSLFFLVRHGQIWRLVSPIFLHLTIIHFVFNMWWLVDLGSSIERRIGGGRLLGLVLVTGVLSNVCQYVIQGPAFGGMSGVVYALVAYAFVRGRMDSTFGLAVPPGAMIILLVWLGFGFTGQLGGVANYAHLGGLLAGAALGVRLKQR
jgi:GlpG protein